VRISVGQRIGKPVSEDDTVIIRLTAAEREDEDDGPERGKGRGIGNGERDEMSGGSNTAAQNSQSNPTKQITPNFLGDSYARCPFALHSRQLRSKETGVLPCAGISRLTTFHLTAPVLPAPLFLHPDHFTDVKLVWSTAWLDALDRSDRDRHRSRHSYNERIEMHSLSCAAI